MSNRTKTEEDNTFCTAVDPGKFLGYIFSGIRHEIGNTINSIKMTSSVLKDNIDRYPREKVLEYIDRVLMETNRVENLLKSLKPFNMFAELIFIDIQLPGFMEKVLAKVETDPEQKKIPVHCHIHPGVGKVNTDPRALEQVLLNILTNAADALPDVENPMISIDIRGDSGKIRFEIADNGPGIAEDHKEEICKPFFTTRRHKTGLGLSIVQNILSRMNGTICFRSKKDTGTSVIIHIPGDKHADA